MVEWYYKRDDSVFGPMSPVLLRDLMHRGRLRESTLLREGEAGEWLTPGQAESALDLAAAASASTEAVQKTHLSGQLADYAGYIPQLRLPMQLRISVYSTLSVLVFMMILWIARVFVLTSQAVPVGVRPEWLQVFSTTAEEFLQFFPLLPAFVFVLLCVTLWQYFAFASIQNLYDEGMMYRSPVSGFWWLVPGANLILPVVCLSELRHLSRKRRNGPQRGLPLGRLLWALEGIILSGVLLYLIHLTLSLAMKASGIPQREMPWYDLLICLIGMAFCVVLILVIMRNFRQQVRLYRHWKDEEYWLLQ